MLVPVTCNKSPKAQKDKAASSLATQVVIQFAKDAPVI